MAVPAAPRRRTIDASQVKKPMTTARAPAITSRETASPITLHLRRTTLDGTRPNVVGFPIAARPPPTPLPHLGQAGCGCAPLPSPGPPARAGARPPVARSCAPAPAPCPARPPAPRGRPPGGNRPPTRTSPCDGASRSSPWLPSPGEPCPPGTGQRSGRGLPRPPATPRSWRTNARPVAGVPRRGAIRPTPTGVGPPPRGPSGPRPPARPTPLAGNDNTTIREAMATTSTRVGNLRLPSFA